MKYQWGTVLPWFINRYIFQKKGLPSPTLYKFDTDDSGNVVPVGGYAANSGSDDGGEKGTTGGTTAPVTAPTS